MEASVRLGVDRATPQCPLPSLSGPERPGHAEISKGELCDFAQSPHVGLCRIVLFSRPERGHLNYLTGCTVCEVIKCPNFHFCVFPFMWKSTVYSVKEFTVFFSRSFPSTLHPKGWPFSARVQILAVNHSTPTCRRADTPVCRCADTPVCDMPTRRHVDTPYAGAPTGRYADDTPIRRHADMPTRRHADTADTPIDRHADMPTL